MLPTFLRANRLRLFTVTQNRCFSKEIIHLNEYKVNR